MRSYAWLRYFFAFLLWWNISFHFLHEQNVVYAASSSDGTSESTLITLQDGWQYRWGDSPQADGVFLWTQDENSPEWKSYSFPASSPPNRPAGVNNVWLRTKLPDLPSDNLHMFILAFDQSAEVFVGSEKIYAYGSFTEKGESQFQGYIWHLIPLKKEYSGKYIYFRVWADHVNIGIVGNVSIGNKAKFIQDIYSESLVNFTVMLLLSFMGFASFLMFLAKRVQREYLYYAIHTLLGLYIFTRTSMKYLIYYDAKFWILLEFVSLTLNAVGLLGFVHVVLGPTYKNYMKHYAHAGFLLALFIVGFWLFNFSNIMKILIYIQLYMLIGVAMAFHQLILSLRKKLLETKIIAIGLSLFVVFAVLEILVAMGYVFPKLMGKAVLIPLGILIFVSSLGVVLVLRFAQVYRRVSLLKRQLEDILAATKEMASIFDKIQVVQSAIRFILHEIGHVQKYSSFVFFYHKPNEGEEVCYGAQILKNGEIIENPELQKLSFQNQQKVNEWMSYKSARVIRPNKFVVPVYWGVEKSCLIFLEGMNVASLGSDEIHFVNTLSNSLALSLANIEFLQKTKEKAALDAELAAAHAVQESLLPASTSFPGLYIAAFYKPAGHTGGDWIGYYYDQANHRLDFFVADVTGHGFSASLLTGVACGGIYTAEELLTALALVDKVEQSTEDRLMYVANVVNGIVMQTGRGNLMMTMALISLDLRTGEVTFVNAGHNAPYIIHRAEQKVKPIPGRGSCLGFSAQPKFSAVKKQLQPGDMLFMYTDGLIENTGPDGETVFSEKMLRKCLAAEGEASVVYQNVIQTAQSIWQNHPPADDVTVLLIQWNGEVPREAVDMHELNLPGAHKLSLSFKTAS